VAGGAGVAPTPAPQDGHHKRAFIAVLTLAFLAGCSENPAGPAAQPGDPKPADKRSIGMPEDIWKVYSGAESGVGEGEKDKSPAQEKK
jgi:hypothetical protein